MSSSLECAFVEPQPGKWYYALQDWSCPVSAWSWREYATCYGPFATEEAAQNHLFDNHNNPGGWSSTPHATYQPDAAWTALIAAAEQIED